jgi:hypothetical protein
MRWWEEMKWYERLFVILAIATVAFIVMVIAVGFPVK